MERLAASFLGQDEPPAPTFTMPSKDAQIGFQVPTQVMEVLVKGGSKVVAGDVLIRGDDSEEQALLKIQEIRSNTTLPVDRARAALELAKIELERMREAFNQAAATEQELKRAEVSVEVGEIDLQTAQWNLDQEKLQFERMKTRADRYRLVAPFDGQVDVVAVDRGDVVKDSEPVIRVVNIDPLWVDVHTPIETSLSLSQGDPAWAMIDIPGRTAFVTGRIIEVSPVTNFATRKQRIRVEIDNPSKWPPGLAVWVRFNEPSEEFKAKFDVGASAGL